MTHVLMTYPGLIPSVLLCGQQQFEHLAQVGKIIFRSIQRNMLTAEDCGWADVVFMVRSDSRFEVELAKKWKHEGRRVFYVLDDDLLNVPDTSSSGGYYSQEEVKRSIQQLLSICDGLLSPSAKLREMYGGDKAFSVEEPSPLHPAKIQRRTGPVRIGFAGSIDRANDLDMLLGKAVEALLKQYGELISVEFFGARPKIANAFQLRCIPYCNDYETYQQTMRKLDWDIGLAPMPETKFHACKHYNKFIEYAGCGIAGIYSDTLPYTRIVQDEVNGLLCSNTPEAWIDALTRLIENVPLRRKIAEYSQQQAKADFSLETTSLLLEQALGEVLRFTAPNHDPIQGLIPLRIKTHASLSLATLRRHGIYTPVVAVKKLCRSIIKDKESIDT